MKMEVVGKKRMRTKPSKYPDTWILKELKNWLKEVQSNKKIVFIKQLCDQKRYSYADMSDAILYNRDKSPLYPQISVAYKRIKEIIEGRLFQGALDGKYNSAIANLGLKNNHKWVDRHEVKQEVSGDFKFTQILDDIERPKELDEGEVIDSEAIE